MKTSATFLFLALSLLSPAVSAAPVDWPKGPLRGANVIPGITEEDLRVLAKDWKANVIRILHNSLLSAKPPHAVNTDDLKSIHATIDVARKLGLYVVIAPGASMDNHDAFFGSAEFKAAYLAFWRKEALMLKGTRGVAFDLMNEPHDEKAKAGWSAYALELTKAIRSVDPERTIMVEPPEWGWPAGFEFLKPTGDANTVYSFHFYGPMDFSHLRGWDEKGTFLGHLKATEAQRQERRYPGHIQKEDWNKAAFARYFEPAVKFAKKHEVILWCGEFGATRWALGSEVWFKDIIDTLEALKMGWAYYAYREWDAMDIEMDASAVNTKTTRTETPAVKLFKRYYSRNLSLSL